MPSSDADPSKVLEQTEQNRLNLLRTDLSMIHTLLGLVETELTLRNHEHAMQTLASATKGYEDICRIFGQRHSWEEQATNEIQGKLADLRKEIDRVQKLVHSRPQGKV